MPAKDLTDQERDAETTVLHPLFGQPQGAAPGPLTAGSLNKLTLKQLVEGARSLGLTSVSKLRKDALVQMVLDAWQARAVGTGGKMDALPTGGDGLRPALTNGEDEKAEPSFSHKFEVGQPGWGGSEEARTLLRESAKAIPWGYGRDRITAMPVDPDRLFAYWEVLDESIATARGKLGRGGPTAWLNLRVYDTTGRIFDGTNAHSVFDNRLERGDRQWFFTIGKPTSELIIEMGLLSDEGYFVKIARSGRVEFPRRAPAPWADPEWLTVRASGQVEHAAARVFGRPVRVAGVAPFGGGIGALGGAGVGSAAAAATAPQHKDGPPDGAVRRVTWADAVHVAGGGVVERHEWEEMHVNGTIEEHRRFRWDGPTTITSWEAGPFTHPVEIPEPVRESYTGKTHVLRSGGRTHVIYGPWQVIIRGLGAQKSRVVLSRWEVHRTWAEEFGHGVEGFTTTYTGGGGGASERMIGASDRRWAGGSETRLHGSSELYFLKASELRLGGASERLYAAASEWMLRGASEKMYSGSSEALRGGASERLMGQGFLGASEGRLKSVAAIGEPEGSGGAGANTHGGGYPHLSSEGPGHDDDKTPVSGGS